MGPKAEIARSRASIYERHGASGSEKGKKLIAHDFGFENAGKNQPKENLR
jgi:hypothetical protein